MMKRAKKYARLNRIWHMRRKVGCLPAHARYRRRKKYLRILMMRLFWYLSYPSLYIPDTGDGTVYEHFMGVSLFGRIFIISQLNRWIRSNKSWVFRGVR